MQLLKQIEVGGLKLYERTSTYDERLKYTWDADIAIEVIANDAYRLRILKDKGIGIQSVVDVGGNIGSFSFFANHLWPDAKITVVEPLPENVEMIKANCAAVKDLKIVPKAVIGSQSKSEKRKFLPPSFIRDAFNKNSGDGRLCEEGEIEVDVCGLIDVLPTGVIDLLKLDCEGAEISILEEAEKIGLFHRIRIIRGETHTPEGADTIKRLLEPYYYMHWAFRGYLGAFGADTRMEM